MPFCAKCGKEVSEDMEFCPECGQRLKEGFTPEERQKYIEELKASVEGGKPPKKTKITRKKLAGIIGGCIIAIIVIAVIATPREPTPVPIVEPLPVPSPTESTVSTREITMADAPAILDMSSDLPVKFEHVDAASEGMSNKDFELGPEFSEVELFLSDEPFQEVFAYMTIIESRAEQAVSDNFLRDEEQVKSQILYYLKQGAIEEGVVLTDVELHTTFPNVGELAILGSGEATFDTMRLGYDLLIFKNGKVYVSVAEYYMGEHLSIVSCTEGINRRIESFRKG